MKLKQNAYSGNGRPFVYTLYAQKDKEGAEAVLGALREKGYETWPSERFDKRRMKKAALVLLVLSQAALESETVNDAIGYALQNDLPMLPVYLEPVELTPGQKLQLNTQQGILRYECVTEAEFHEKLFVSSLLKNLTVTRAQKRAALLTNWGIACGVLAAAALTLILTLGMRTTVRDGSLLAELGYSGELSEIESLYIYGTELLQERSEPVICSKIYDKEFDNTRVSLFYYDLNYETAYGDLDDISDFRQLKNLRELSIAANQVEDISPLYRLHNLEYLDLSGNPVSNIKRIGALTNLKTLCIGGTLIDDISALNNCESLEQVYVDPEQYHAFTDDGQEYSFVLTPVGPQQELLRLSCDIFGGPTEHCRFGVWIRTVSGNVYEDYTYEFYKNDEQVKLTGRAYDDPTMDKVHLLFNDDLFGAYDPDSVYTLIVRYGTSYAKYQIWHYTDSSAEHANFGELIEW